MYYIAFQETIPRAVNTSPATLAAPRGSLHHRQPRDDHRHHRRPTDHQPRPAASTTGSRADNHHQHHHRRPADHQPRTTASPPAAAPTITTSTSSSTTTGTTTSTGSTSNTSSSPPPAHRRSNDRPPHPPATIKTPARYINARVLIRVHARRYCARPRARLRVPKPKNFVGVKLFFRLPRPGGQKVEGGQKRGRGNRRAVPHHFREVNKMVSSTKHRKPFRRGWQIAGK